MPVADHIDNATRSVTFTPAASAGPFALPFPIYEADSAAELKSDFLIALDGVVQTAYSVSGTFTDGVAINGAVTMDAPVTGTLIIYSRRRPRSSVDLANGQAVTALELQAIVNGMLASVRDVYDWMTSLEAANVLPAGTFVPTAGGAMTGFLDLNADPTTALKAATKQYVDGKLPITTKGDLIGHNGTVPVRLAVGSNGKGLVADSTAASGLAWARRGGAVQTLTDAANIAWNMDLGDDAKVTLAGNRTMDAPTNIIANNFGFFDVVQDATGGRTLAWDATFVFIYAFDKTPNPTASSTTRFEWRVVGATVVIWQVRPISAAVLETQTISAAASAIINLQQFPYFTHFKILASQILPATDATTLELHFSADGGSTYITAAASYSMSGIIETSGAISNIQNSVGTIDVLGTPMGNAANEFAQINMDVFDAASASANTGLIIGVGGRNSTPHGYGGIAVGGLRLAAETTTHLRLRASAGNISMLVKTIGLA